MKCINCGFNNPNIIQILGGKSAIKKRFAGLSKKEISEIMRKMRRGEKLS